MHWSKLKKNVESRFARSVAGRVELRLTSYRHAHDGHGLGWITIDGIEIANMCYWESLQKGAYDPNHISGTPSGIMDPHLFVCSLIEYTSLSVDEALASPNFLIRAIAMLDERVAKRRLESTKLERVQKLFDFRYEAEGMHNTAKRHR